MAAIDHIRAFYREQAGLYQRLVARQDYQRQLIAALTEISPLAERAARVYAFDIERAMLVEARAQLRDKDLRNWSLVAADNGRMPLPANCADLAIEGWSFNHALDWQPNAWRELVDQLLAEMQRVLKPGGVAILIEDLGIGRTQPQAPSADVARLYNHWQERHGFQHRWIRSDYQFASPSEASELAGMFFGATLAEQCLRSPQITLPECTGIWWKRF